MDFITILWDSEIYSDLNGLLTVSIMNCGLDPYLLISSRAKIVDGDVESKIPVITGENLGLASESIQLS